MTAAQSVMMAVLILSWDLQKLQFPTPTSTIQLWAQFHSIIHFIWADIKELITELEISGSL